MDPYPHYEQLREAGGAVHLNAASAFALPRYAEVRAALADWQTFSSRGIGLTERLTLVARSGDAIRAIHAPTSFIRHHAEHKETEARDQRKEQTFQLP